MKVLLTTQLTHRPDPFLGEWRSAGPTFREIVDGAVLAEELGFDGYGVGEYEDRPFVSVLWPRTLEAVIARTGRIRIFSAVIGIWLLDPLRAIREYSGLDRRSGGRLELVLGHGDGGRAHRIPAMRPGREARTQAVHALFRRRWEQARDSADPRVPPPRIWHRCALRTFAVDLAARYDDPIFLSDATAAYGGLRQWYAARRAHYGRDPGGGPVGAGGVAYYGARRSQDAFATYRPIFEARSARLRRLGLPCLETRLEDAVRRGSILLGSPQQIIDTVLGQYAQLRHQVMHLHADGDGLTAGQHRAALELFQSEVAPALRP